MKKHSRLNKFLSLIGSFLLVLFFALLVILTFQLKDIKNSNNRTNTYIGWCKSAFDNPRNPSDEWYNKRIKKCVKGWKKLEKDLKK